MKKFIVLAALFAAGSAFAQDDFDAKRYLIENASNNWTLAIKYAAYFFAMAIAAYGGTKAQSNAAATALEGMARNPAAADKLFTPMLIGLALMESLVIFVLATAFLV